MLWVAGRRPGKALRPRMLEIRDLVKAFGSLRAVDGVSLEVGAGTITGLIGPNGAGKTTLFNTIAGELAPDAGEIRLRGERIDGLTPDRVFRKGIARTFQIARPFPEMTVLENLMLVPSEQTGERFWNNWVRRPAVGREERALRRRAREVAAFTNLERVMHDPARTLSGGQRKLLELARLMMAEPAIMLLDEPAAGVNPALMEVLVDKIQELHRQGTTFLIIEHNMDLVMSICAPIAVMAQGRLVTEGDAATVRADPRVLDAYLGDVPA
jgi:branched-chain amino acid transport system ATP-binding protein